MVNRVYKRGQVEEALWRYFTYLLPGGSPTPSPVFRARIKRLVELDWMQETAEDSEVPHPRFAFREGAVEGKGRDASYTLFNACCLAFGLDLLDMGFKQSEVVFLLRHLREKLQKEFTFILNNPPAPRQRIPAEDRPNCLWYEEQGLRLADCRVYAVIQKVELTELIPRRIGRKPHRRPVFPAPVFCRGSAAVGEELHRMNRKDYSYRKAFVIELAHTVVLVQQYLDDAPVVLRGRK